MFFLAWMLGIQIAKADCVCDNWDEQYISDRAQYDSKYLPEPDPTPTPEPTEDNGQ